MMDLSRFTPEWMAPQEEVVLQGSTIHLWRYLADSRGDPPIMEGVFSPDEIEKSGRFRSERHQQQYRYSRYMLRMLLSRYTGIAPASIVLTYNRYGKPCLPGSPVNFNLTHSGNLTICAVGYQSEIGIDTEEMVSTPDLPVWANRFFSASEAARFNDCNGNDKTMAFYSCWTKKEAYIKAKGMGLNIPLCSFAVSPFKRATLEYSELYHEDEARFLFHTFEPATGYIATLASNDSHFQPRYFDARELF